MLFHQDTTGYVGDTERPTYVNFVKKNGIFLASAQITDVDVSTFINQSGLFDGDWDDMNEVSTRQADEDEHYVMDVYNQEQINDELLIDITGRDDDVTPRSWFRRYLIRANITGPGSKTFYNWDKSVSKTSRLLEADMNNYAYYYTGYDTASSLPPMPATDLNGNFYDIARDTLWGFKFIIMIQGQSIQYKDINLPGSPIPAYPPGVEAQAGPFNCIVPISPEKIYIFVRIDTGPWDKVYCYKTTDLGDTWEEIGDVFPDIDDDIRGFGYPLNGLEIPENRNFVFVATSNPDPTILTAAVYMRRAAFGTIQPEEGDPYDVTAYTESEYDDLMLRSYYVEAGKVTNTGTTCNSLIDQSASAQDATSTGSPVMDSGTTPTYVQLDGVNDFFSIPLTGVVNLTEGSIIAVVQQDAAGVNGTFLTASQHTTNNHFLLYTIRSDSVTQFNDTNSVVNRSVDTHTKTTYHIFVFTHQNAGVSGNVLHFVDGKLQKRNPVTRNINEGSYFTGTLQHTSTDWTRLLIGKLDWNSADTFTKFRLKHLAITAEPLNTEQLKKSMRYLADKYSITLTDEYYK
jgi:hypothetical protein